MDTIPSSLAKRTGEPAGLVVEDTHSRQTARIALFTRLGVGDLLLYFGRDVIRRGTAKRALQLGRQDLAGKTGTTNDHRDAWFAGYNDSMVAVSWIGFDTPQSLGSQETGGYAALPIWINFMGVALKDVPERTLEQPEGLVSVRINPETGLLAGTGAAGAIFETFPENAVPGQDTDTPPAIIDGPSSATGTTENPAVPEQLF